MPQPEPQAPDPGSVGAGLFSSSLAIAALFIVAKGVGFLRDPIIASLYGASARSDSYYVTLGFAYLAYGIAVGGMTASVVPVFVARRVEAGDASAWSFLGAYVSWLAALFLACSGILFAWPDAVLHLFSPGLAAAARPAAVAMLRIFALVPLITAISSTLASALNCYDRFLLPAAVPLAGNLISILLLLLLTRPLGLVGAAWAFLVGTTVQAGSLAMVAWRHARRFGPRFVLVDGALRRTVRLAVPGLLSEGLIYVNYLVIVYLATSLEAGVFSSIQYSTKVQQVFIEIFIAAFGAVMFPQLARAAAGGDRKHLARLHSHNLVLVALVLLPITALVVLLRTPLIQILYERHAFDADATRRTAAALGLGVLSLVPAGVKDAAVRTFYALHDSVTPLLAVAPAVALNVALDFVLVKSLGGGGLMLAFSVAMAVLAIILLAALARRGVLRVDADLRGSVAKIVVATAVMSLVVWTLRTGIESGVVRSWPVMVARLLGYATLAGVVYLGTLLALRERHVEAVGALLGSRLRRL